MEKYLLKQISVPFDALYPDPNNPRLALEGAPGYADVEKLFDEDLKEKIVKQLSEEAYGIEELATSILGQGWMPIDNMIVWKHPDEAGKYVVVEGNRRTIALHRLRTTVLEKARKKLDTMTKKASSYAKSDLEEAKKLVQQLELLVEDTNMLSVMPVAAETVSQLEHKLPRVLAVRHITGARDWGNYAQDLWLLTRFEQLFEDVHGPDEALFWDSQIIKQVAAEASLNETNAKRQLKAAKWFSHFRYTWEDELPGDETFGKEDYYLFELISKKPWVRTKLGIGEDAIAIPEAGEIALFKWVFKEARTPKADDNPNTFYRHENILLWDQIKRYDDAQGTSFASRFDVENPDEAPTMREVEAEYLTHKATKKPHAALDDLLKRLNDLTAEELANGGTFLRTQLEQVSKLSQQFLKMINAAGD
jgi:hypothetical protein